MNTIVCFCHVRVFKYSVTVVFLSRSRPFYLSNQCHMERVAREQCDGQELAKKNKDKNNSSDVFSSLEAQHILMCSGGCV